jgi:transposase
MDLKNILRQINTNRLNSHHTFLICDPPKVAGGGRAVHPINWRSKYGGMDASMMSELKSMADENRRLKKMYAEMSMQNELLKEALGKKR